jgi:hypothetical protein
MASNFPSPTRLKDWPLKQYPIVGFDRLVRFRSFSSVLHQLEPAFRIDGLVAFRAWACRGRETEIQYSADRDKIEPRGTSPIWECSEF